MFYGIECARRSVITPTPEWAKNVIEFEIKTSMQFIDLATYQLNIFYYSRWLTDNHSNIDQYILKRNENEYTNQFILNKFPYNEFSRQKKQWQINEKIEFVKMSATYLLNGCLVFLIVLIEILFFSTFDKNNFKLTALSFVSFIFLLYCSLNISLESFNYLIAIVWIPFLLVINSLVILIDKIHKLVDRHTQ
jgi:hypothetical protein